MYSKPDNWNFTIKSMEKQLKEGYRTISNALNELKINGWVVYEKQRTGRGVYHLIWDKKPLNKPKLQNVSLAQLNQNCKTDFCNLGSTKPKLQNCIKHLCSPISNKEEIVIEEEAIKEKETIKNWFPEIETMIFIENQYGLIENDFIEQFKLFKMYVLNNNKKYPDLDSSFILHIKKGIEKGLIEQGVKK